MKGLFYKDFIDAKGYIVVAAFYLLYTFMMVGLAVWDFNCAVGLEQKLTVLSQNYMTLLACLIVDCFIPTTMALVICGFDNKTKWTNYALALPGGYKAVVAEKYIITLFGDVIAVIASLAVVFTVKHHFEVEVDGMMIEDVGADAFIILMLLSVGMSLVASAFILPFICRSKANRLEIFFGVCLVIVVYVGFAYLALGDISFLQQDNQMEIIAAWIAKHKKAVWGCCYGFVGAGIASQVVSYVVTVKTYLKYT